MEGTRLTKSGSEELANSLFSQFIRFYSYVVFYSMRYISLFISWYVNNTPIQLFLKGTNTDTCTNIDDSKDLC